MPGCTNKWVVDIGNSGLRTAPVHPGVTNPADVLPSLLTEPSRLQWLDKPTKHATRYQIAPNDVQAMQHWLSNLDGLPKNAVHWLISSVQRQAATSLLHAIGDLRPHDTFHLVTHRDVPMPIDVEYPDRLGIDRLLAAWGAYQVQHQSGPLIVIQTGTAVTVDWVSEQGQFGGGAIMAGLPITLDLLAKGTDLLPHVASPDHVDSIVLPGKNTEQAMLAGASAALVGGVQWLVDRYRSQSSAEVPVVISGGDSPSFAKHIPTPLFLIDQLVLRSLALLDLTTSKPVAVA